MVMSRYAVCCVSGAGNVGCTGADKSANVHDGDDGEHDDADGTDGDVFVVVVAASSLGAGMHDSPDSEAYMQVRNDVQNSA